MLRITRMPRILLTGLLLCLIQISLLMALAPKEGGFVATYHRLTQWDSGHYKDITENGYHVECLDDPSCKNITSEDIHRGRANAVFFPGYPMATRLMKNLTGVSTLTAQLWVAQLCAWAFWVYFILLLEFFGASPTRVRLATLLVAVHPAAFYLVCGYSESQFLAGLLGFIYWTQNWARNPRPGTWLLAAAHGTVISFTRIVSYAAAPLPWIARRKWSAIALGFTAIVGSWVYFAFCQHRFGHWNLYFMLEEIGWANHKKWLAVINPLSYVPHFFFEHTLKSINRAALPLTAFLFWVAYRLEKKSGQAFEWLSTRSALYLCAFALFYIPVTGKANANFESMIRYALPVYVIQMLCIAQHDWSGLKARKGWFVLAIVLIFAVQLWMTSRFVRALWVA